MSRPRRKRIGQARYVEATLPDDDVLLRCAYSLLVMRMILSNNIIYVAELFPHGTTGRLELCVCQFV